MVSYVRKNVTTAKPRYELTFDKYFLYDDNQATDWYGRVLSFPIFRRMRIIYKGISQTGDNCAKYESVFELF